MKGFSFTKSLFVLLLFSFGIFIAGCAKKEEENKIPVTTTSEEAKAEFLKGRDLFEKQRQQESLQHFTKAIEMDNNFALAYYYHSLANPTTKGFFEDLEKTLALTDKVSEGEKLMILSLKAGVDGDQKKQEEHLKKLVELYPEDERAHNQLGQFYFGQQEYSKAVDHMKKSTEIAAAYSAPYNMMGYAYRNLRDYDQAEKAFEKYIELIPDDPNPYDSYAELLLKEGKYDESITQYQKALDVNSNFVASHLGIATNLTYLKKYDDARNQCQKLFDMARNDGEKRAALFSKTISYIAEGKTDLAMDEMQKQYLLGEAINDAGAMSGDLNAMGNILFEAGKYDEAKTKYDLALQVALNSNLPEEVKENTKRLDLYNQSRILLMKGKLEDAKIKAQEFSEKTGTANNTFQIWLSHELNGLIALEEKDFAKAQQEFTLANQQNPYTFYRLALANKGANNKEEAKKNCEMSLQFNGLTNMNQAFVTKKAEKLLTTL